MINAWDIFLCFGSYEENSVSDDTETVVVVIHYFAGRYGKDTKVMEHQIFCTFSKQKRNDVHLWPLRYLSLYNFRDETCTHASLQTVYLMVL